MIDINASNIDFNNDKNETDYTQMMRNREFQWMVADILAKKRLEGINSNSDKVIPSSNFYTKYGKRALDIFFSAIVLIITLPINLVIAIITLIELGLPLFFKQERSGKNGNPFTIVKFRNMNNKKDADGNLLPGNLRVSKSGKFFRRTSLDELLNFWSILKGDMSLIGPRPLPPQYLHRYSDRHRARLSVRPGLECPPRDNVSKMRNWQDQFENDVWYVENLSFKNDFMLVINLIKFTFDRKNSKARASVARGSFIGYSENGIAISSNDLSDEFIKDLISGEN